MGFLSWAKQLSNDSLSDVEKQRASHFEFFVEQLEKIIEETLSLYDLRKIPSDKSDRDVPVTLKLSPNKSRERLRALFAKTTSILKELC